VFLWATQNNSTMMAEHITFVLRDILGWGVIPVPNQKWREAEPQTVL
jgi:hypothetical protein